MTDEARMVCRVAGHDFPIIEGGQECERCGIIFCPVAYDHDDYLGYCGVCGWSGE